MDNYFPNIGKVQVSIKLIIYEFIYHLSLFTLNWFDMFRCRRSMVGYRVSEVALVPVAFETSKHKQHLQNTLGKLPINFWLWLDCDITFLFFSRLLSLSLMKAKILHLNPSCYCRYYEYSKISVFITWSLTSF